MLFGRSRTRRDDFEREVLAEMSYLRDVHGEDAYAKGLESAQRPRLGRERRKVIEEAIKRIGAGK